MRSHGQKSLEVLHKAMSMRPGGKLRKFQEMAEEDAARSHVAHLISEALKSAHETSQMKLPG